MNLVADDLGGKGQGPAEVTDVVIGALFVAGLVIVVVILGVYEVMSVFLSLMYILSIILVGIIALAYLRLDPKRRKEVSQRFLRILAEYPLYGSLLKGVIKKVEDSEEERKSYVERLEDAEGDEVFKYILLINNSVCDLYVAQTRLQASESFRLCQIVSVVGFILLIVGIGVGIYTHLYTELSLDAALLTTGAGILTEFISGVFFRMYNKTLQQMSEFHDRLVSSQRIALGLLTNSTVTSETTRNESKIALSRMLVSANTEETT
ncbi:MAG: hypothetical protein LN417_04270 [Candidatus Thermoplasmatota archaeon]|nr:hypothetical protein [Candidatus Thermoplasmatota archaeon]